MIEADAPALFALLDDIWTLKGTALLGGAQKALFFAALSPYGIAEVKAGLMAHVRDPKRGQYLPMPADVIAQINDLIAADGRPGPEEAWAQCRQANDERVTLAWTDEMAEAFGIARPLLQEGDDVGARMAFREAYNRLVEAARAGRIKPSWSVTLGTDKTLRNAALLPHVQAGRVSSDLLLTENPSVKSIEGLLALPAPEGETEAAKTARAAALASMKATRERIAARQAEQSAVEAEEAAAFALELAEKEAETARNSENP